MAEDEGTVTPIRPDIPAAARVPVAGTPDDGRSTLRAGRLTSAQKRTTILAMYAGGAPPQGIVDALGAKGHRTTVAGVTRILNRALEEMAQADLANVEKVRQRQLLAIDQVMIRVFSMARDGNLKAVDRFERLEKLRARIAGTEAPQRHEHTGAIDHRISPEEIGEMERKWLESGGVDGTAVEETDAMDALPAGG